MASAILRARREWKKKTHKPRYCKDLANKRYCYLPMAPKLDDDAINDVNAIASYLALTNELDVRKDGNGVVILAGNAILATAEAAFEIAVSRGVPVLISGGRGHSTELLEEAICAHPHYGNIVTGGRAEAEMLGDLAVRYCSIPSDRIHLETASTNCGENASCSLASLNRLGLHPQWAILVQDPLMQRRTDASFRHAWSKSVFETSFLNYPVFTPQVALDQGCMVYQDTLPSGLWTHERFLSLLLGEVPRLRDDKHGYGPVGAGFIAHVDVPNAVQQAHARLTVALGDNNAAVARIRQRPND